MLTVGLLDDALAWIDTGSEHMVVAKSKVVLHIGLPRVP